MEYNERVLEHFFTPRNIGEIKDPDGQATVGDPSCGDFIKVWIKVKNNVITDFQYKVFGCGAAIATTSVVSEMVIGKSIEQALAYTDYDVVAYLGGLPSGKEHCSLLGIRGLHAALSNVEVKQNHQKYLQRIELFRSKGYDISQARSQLVSYLGNVSRKEWILDVGTGKGHLALALAKAGFLCVSIDLSREEQLFAELNAEHFNVKDHIDFRIMDASNMDFPSHSFRAVVAANLIHHLPNPEPVFAEMVRVKQKDGLIFIADVNKRGQQILAEVHKSEGRVHKILGWPMVEVQKWFLEHGHKVRQLDNNCEIVLQIKTTSF